MEHEIYAVALIAARNEAPLIEAQLRHCRRQGLFVYLLDDGSTDDTVAIASQYLGRGLLGLELLPTSDTFELRTILERKQALARTLQGRWFIHLDVDEFIDPPPGFTTVSAALFAAEQAGFNTAHAREFVFLPTREAPDHEHGRFQETMRHYHPFEPFTPVRRIFWSMPAPGLDLATQGGHQVQRHGLLDSPAPFTLRHYLYLSLNHAHQKYAARYQENAPGNRAGWNGWRNHYDRGRMSLPWQHELRALGPAGEMDASSPWKQHYAELCHNRKEGDPRETSPAVG